MLKQREKKSYLKFKNINFVLHHPLILKNIIQGKSKEEIRANARKLIEVQTEKLELQQVLDFISFCKKNSPYYINENYQPKLNRLCYIEDWGNEEFKNIVNKLHHLLYENYIKRKD